MRIDAHCHTDCSDGNISIKERIALIKRLKFGAATITDHDFISDEQVSTARSEAGDMPYIPGIELSLVHENRVVHLLGYFVDPGNNNLQVHIRNVQAVDREYTIRMIEAGRNRGITFNIEDLVSRSLHTFYSMQFVRKTAALLFSNDRKKMLDFMFYLYEKTHLDYPAFSDWPVRKGIDIIHDAGGIAVLAHPGGEEDRLMRSLDFLLHNENHIRQYTDWGLDGIEVSSPNHTQKEKESYSEQAALFNLLTTAGSDCHGDDPFLGPALMGKFDDLPEDLYERITACHRGGY